MANLNLYWGELHNHNELGYAQGSLERSYEIARSHLDFYAFTPHGLHADGGVPDGYPVVVANWERIRRAARENDRPGEFTCFPAYEWHSTAWGHLHVLSVEDMGSMYCAKSLMDLQNHFRNRQAIVVPHHTAYERGVDWEGFDAALSPVVEIFSEHGSSERDSGLHPMLGHSGGPAGYQYTVQHGLALGKRFGFTAGTDNHDGYPGGYGLGLTGIWAEENTRAGLFDALKKRRTTAVTGDRIEVLFRAGDAWMGEVVSGSAERRLDYRVRGWDAIKSIELVRGNVPVQVALPDYGASTSGSQRYRLRFEWGWGPMKGYQVYDWLGQLQVVGGRLTQVVPCFSSDPFDEGRRKLVLERDQAGCTWQSHTSRGSIFTTRNGSTAPRANDALCVEVEGTEETRIELGFECRTSKSLLATSMDWSLTGKLGFSQRSFSIGELIEGRQGWRVDDYSTWIVAHRALPEARYALEGHFADQALGPAYYYLRVTQENGQLAWSSPIWFGE